MYEEYSTQAFEEAYTYTGNDLGSLWTPLKTTFRVWAPTAEAVTVALYHTGYVEDAYPYQTFPMAPDRNGTWYLECPGNWKDTYYTYQVTVAGCTREAPDPYAIASGLNGNRSYVSDFSGLDPQGWDTDCDPHAGAPITDAVIYELHIRDFSMRRSGRISHHGKYTALTKTGRTTSQGAVTGLDHIKNLGVTHIHLLPIFKFGSTVEAVGKPAYNWGYDPVLFNVPEGTYADNCIEPTARIREVKQMVKALHDNGLSVIMDVVYNHVYDADSFCFNRIVPGYFSRIDSDGNYSNGSCCGNDTASERSMVRKYIVDSVNYWADAYHIDGFRFDLAGLLDVETIQQVIHTVHMHHPNVLFYGEGWQMNTRLTKPDLPLAVQGNSPLLPDFSFFSDNIRDMLRGSIFDQHAPGFVAGGKISREDLENNFMGMPSWAAEPRQCVNYVSCHDNYTLFDRIALTAPDASFEDRVRMNNLAAAFSLLAQGVPFFQAGEEMLRTKKDYAGRFIDNSYRGPDLVNSLKWETLNEPIYQETVAYYRGIIALRKAHPVLRLQTRKAVKNAVHPIRYPNERVATFHMTGQGEELFLLFNSDTRAVTVPLPEGIWEIHALDNRASVESLGTADSSMVVPPISTLFLSRKTPVEVVAALIWEKDKFLICQRPATKSRGLLWEFVGGKVEPGETKEQALARECSEELAVSVDVGSRFWDVYHEYSDIHIHLTIFHCTIPTGQPQALEHNDIRWIHPSQIDDYPFCPADEEILRQIKETYENRQPL